MADYEGFGSDPLDSALCGCRICGRRFLPETLERHEPICEKNATKKRKVFQSGKQRAQGSDVPLKNIIRSDLPPPKAEPIGKKNNWREKHLDFVNTIRAARGVTEAIKNGGPLPPPPAPSLNPDYVQCPTCNRRFNETAAERHMPFCAEKNKRISDKKVPSTEAQRRMAARLTYKTARPKISKPEDEYNYSPSSAPASRVQNQMYSEGQAYGLPMRTGKTESNYNAGLAMRSNSLDRRKSGDPQKTAIPRINSYDSVAKVNKEYPKEPKHRYSPSPPTSGRQKPSSGNYQHRFRDGNTEDSSIIRRVTSKDINDNKNNHNINGGFQTTISRFCHECGVKYCRNDAKFCCDCGSKRIFIS